MFRNYRHMIIDISNDVSPGYIWQAYYCIIELWKNFPLMSGGTVLFMSDFKCFTMFMHFQKNSATRIFCLINTWNLSLVWTSYRAVLSNLFSYFLNSYLNYLIRTIRIHLYILIHLMNWLVSCCELILLKNFLQLHISPYYGLLELPFSFSLPPPIHLIWSLLFLSIIYIVFHRSFHRKLPLFPFPISFWPTSPRLLMTTRVSLSIRPCPRMWANRSPCSLRFWSPCTRRAITLAFE